MVALSLSLEAIYGYLSSTLSYRVVAVCLLSVPVTHAIGQALYTKGARSGSKPSPGGNRHVLLVAMSYVSNPVEAVAHARDVCTLQPAA